MRALQIVEGYCILIEGNNHDPFLAHGNCGLPFFAKKRKTVMAFRRELATAGIPMRRTRILKVEVQVLEALITQMLSE